VPQLFYQNLHSVFKSDEMWFLYFNELGFYSLFLYRSQYKNLENRRCEQMKSEKSKMPRVKTANSAVVRKKLLLQASAL